MKATTQLLIIDPQNDFCDIAGAALPVAGANADMQRLAGLIARHGDRFDAIHVTLDSHHPVDIAHPAWWRDTEGQPPAPFTLISVAEVETGRWRCADPARQASSLAYVRQLAERGRYQLIIWPEHCLIGSWGQAVHGELAQALDGWARERLGSVNYVNKGENPSTEHYSAIQAEVPTPDDPATSANLALLAKLAEADTIVIAGEALSHCVASTVRDLVEALGPGSAAKLVLLRDCCSPVPGFEALGKAFLDELVAQGMRLATSEDFASN
ncbi:hypothetical protein [Chitinimonas sp.]|uniref:hypothetical protein n=1 Tax=Chitinimonas sp. TaxID=1934313 RepID=UPI0035B2914D